MNKVAFIIPVAPKHYEHVKRFILQIRKYKLETDIYVVLSEGVESKSLTILDGVSYIVCPKEYNHCGVVNSKKFWALERIYNNYEYVFLIDSEHYILKYVDLYKLAQDFYNKKIIQATKVLDPEVANDVVIGCVNTYFKDYNLNNITEQRLYFWNNQFAIYERETTKRFLDFIKSKHPNFLLNLTQHHFDYIIYIYYCLLFENWNIINLTENIGQSLYHSLNEEIFRCTNIKKVLRLINPVLMSRQNENILRLCKDETEDVFALYDVQDLGYEFIP